MPNTTDSDLNKSADQNIVFRCNVDCESCGAVVPDVEFDSGAKDEDGLTDLAPGDLATTVTCPACGQTFEAEYEGWLNYGDA